GYAEYSRNFPCGLAGRRPAQDFPLAFGQQPRMGLVGLARDGCGLGVRVDRHQMQRALALWREIDMYPGQAYDGLKAGGGMDRYAEAARHPGIGRLAHDLLRARPGFRIIGRILPLEGAD